MYDATKLQDDERLSGKKRDGIAGVDFHEIETLLLQRNLQSRTKYAMHVSLKLGRFVDYSKKWRLRLSDVNVFQHLASTLSGVVIAIEITTRVAAVGLTFHVDVRTSNDVGSNRASPYIATYGCMTRRNSRRRTTFRKETGRDRRCQSSCRFPRYRNTSFAAERTKSD